MENDQKMQIYLYQLC